MTMLRKIRLIFATTAVLLLVLGCKPLESSKPKGRKKTPELGKGRVELPATDDDVLIDIGEAPGGHPPGPGESSEPRKPRPRAIPKEVLSGQLEFFNTTVIFDCEDEEAEFHNRTLAEWELKTFSSAKLLAPIDPESTYLDAVLERFASFQPLTAGSLRQDLQELKSSVFDFRFHEQKIDERLWIPKGCSPYHIAGVGVSGDKAFALMDKQRFSELAEREKALVFLSLQSSVMAQANGVTEKLNPRRFVHFLVGDFEVRDLGEVFNFIRLVDPTPLFEYRVGGEGDVIFLSHVAVDDADYTSPRYHRSFYYDSCGYYIKKTNTLVHDKECSKRAAEPRWPQQDGGGFRIYTSENHHDYYKTYHDGAKIVQVKDASGELTEFVSAVELGFPPATIEYQLPGWHWPDEEGNVFRNVHLTYSEDLEFEGQLLKASCQKNEAVTYLRSSQVSDLNLGELPDFWTEPPFSCTPKGPVQLSYLGQVVAIPEEVKYKSGYLRTLVVEDLEAPFTLPIGEYEYEFQVGTELSQYKSFKFERPYWNKDERPAIRIRQFVDPASVNGLNCELQQTSILLRREDARLSGEIVEDCEYLAPNGLKVFFTRGHVKWQDGHYYMTTEVRVDAATARPEHMHTEISSDVSSTLGYPKRLELQAIWVMVDDHKVYFQELYFDEVGNIDEFRMASFVGHFHIFNPETEETLKLDASEYGAGSNVCIDLVNDRLVMNGFSRGKCEN